MCVSPNYAKITVSWKYDASSQTNQKSLIQLNSYTLVPLLLSGMTGMTIMTKMTGMIGMTGMTGMTTED